MRMGRAAITISPHPIVIAVPLMAYVMRTLTLTITALVFLASFSGCFGDESGNESPPEEINESLRINHIQMEGTHNSYHVEPLISPTREYRYTHQPLDIQASQLGVRHFEIDVWWDVRDGLRVYHNQYDSGTTCPTFQQCMETLLTWSKSNDQHHPVMIWVEPKDWAEQAAEITTTVELSGILEEIESEISEFWPRNKTITPDDVRGEYSTLNDGMMDDGWPFLDESRGKAIFVLLATGGMRDLYLENYPGLKDARMFTMFSPENLSDLINEDTSAIISLVDPIENWELISSLVQEGYIVRTRADVGGEEADNNDKSRFEAALSSGAHTIVTDYPGPVEELDYWIEIPEGNPSRCNPVTAPIWCDSSALESL